MEAGSDIKKEVLSILNSDAPFRKKIHQISYGKIDKVKAIEACVDIQKSGEFDFIAIIKNASSKDDVDDFFSVSFFLCDIIPYLEFDTGEILKIIDKMIDFGGQDLVANHPISCLKEWLLENISSCNDIINSALEGDANASKYFACAIEFENNFEAVKKMSKSTESEQKIPGLRALAFLKYSSFDDAKNFFEEVTESNSIFRNDSLLANYLFSLLEIAKSGPNGFEEFALNKIKNLDLTNENNFSYHQIATSLFINQSNYDVELIKVLLHKMVTYNQEMEGTRDKLDMALGALWSGGKADLVSTFIQEIAFINSSRFELKNYQHLLHCISDSGNEIISEVLTKWLLSDNRSLLHCASAVVFDLVTHPVRKHNLNLSLAIDKENAVFLCQKSIGMFFGNEELVSSIFLNAMRTLKKIKANSELKYLEELYFEVLLINYPSLQEELKNIGSKDPIYRIAKSLYEKSLVFEQGLKSSNTVRELMPSEEERMTEFRLRSQIFKRAAQNSESKSVFLSLISRQKILYGGSTINILRDSDGKTHLTTTQMQKISHSHYIPRMMIWDEFNFEMMIITYRNLRFGQ